MNANLASGAAPVRRVLLMLLATSLVGCSKSDPAKLLAEARELRDKGQHNAAIIQLKNVIGEAPENADARYLLGMVYLESGDAASAEKELRRALDLRYDVSQALAPYGRSLLAQGQFKKALDEVRPPQGLEPKAEAEILSVRGLALLALRRPDEAQAAFDQALSRHPESPWALLGAARLAGSSGKLDEAARLLERAVAGAPRNAEAWMMKGDLARAADKQAAEQAYRKALELQPQNVLAMMNVALLRIDAADVEGAAKLAEAMRKAAPKSPHGSYVQALIEFRKQSYPAARDAVQAALKAAPDHMPSVLLAGVVEHLLGNQGQAQIHLGRVVEAAPGNLYARKLLVASLARSGQAQRAREVLDVALKQAPQDGSVLGLAGEIAMLNNDFQQAGELFAKAAKLEPKSAGLRTGLALTRFAAGEADTGLADLEAAAALDAEGYQADVLLVLSHLRRGAFDQALRAVQTLEKKQPDNPLTYNLKAAIYLGKKDAAAARKHLERALEIAPTYTPAAANLAQLDLQDNNPKAARARLETVLQKEANNVQALLTLASLAPRLGAGVKEQVEWLERARRASPSSVQPTLMLVRLHAESGEVKKALEVAQQALAAKPDQPEVLDALGAAQLAAGERNQALATYSKLVGLQPESALAHFRLAGAHAANARPQEAAASLEKALALNPQFIEAHVALAQVEAGAGRPGEAMKIAQRLQKEQPKSPAGFMLEGDILVAEKKHAQAAKAYEAAYALGRSAQLAVRIHAAYSNAGRPAEADARIAQWMKQAPDDPVARLYLADASLRAGNHKKAIEHYEALLQKQSDNVIVLNNLAWAYQQTKDARALATAERAYKLKPDNAAIADTLGWILYEQNSLPRALEILRNAVRMAPAAMEIRFHLAQALAKSGDRAGARRELEQLLAAGKPFGQEAEAKALLAQMKN
ncbi:MAG: XrtA/PEP-CTERM system TPR-repeat protein PrsT [Betaproteobacteria bacterium]